MDKNNFNYNYIELTDQKIHTLSKNTADNTLVNTTVSTVLSKHLCKIL